MSFIQWTPEAIYAAKFIIFNPVFWNIAAQLQYRFNVLTKLALGRPKLGCYLLAVTIFSLGIFRDKAYHDALNTQTPQWVFPGHTLVALGLLLWGNTLVLTSMWQLGVTGTYLGDYFGILMDHIVTGFPFNVCNNPMYVGSTLSFLGTAVWYGAPLGFALSALVWGMYWVALRFEEPFTARIYAERDALEAKKAKKTKN